MLCKIRMVRCLPDGSRLYLMYGKLKINSFRVSLAGREGEGCLFLPHFVSSYQHYRVLIGSAVHSYFRTSYFRIIPHLVAPKSTGRSSKHRGSKELSQPLRSRTEGCDVFVPVLNELRI